MSNFTFNGGVSGQSYFGDHGQNISLGQAAHAEALRQFDQLIELLRAEQPGQMATAVRLRGELAGAGADDGTAPTTDDGRLRDWLATIREGATASSGAVALVASLRQLLGL